MLLTKLTVNNSVKLDFLHLDDCIRTDEDIENYLGLSVLGDIPNVNSKVKKHYGYYSPYDRRNSTKGKKEDKIWKR